MAARLFTIGFAETSAEAFFGSLRSAGVRRLLDVRLNNTSQLAGFTKKPDLQFFLRRIGDIDYVELPVLAPTKPMLDGFKKHGGSWERYEAEYRELLAVRAVASSIPRELLDLGCLLCSEKRPDYCHRRLAAEYFAQAWPGLEVAHLL